VHAVAYIFAVRLLALLKYIMNEVARRARNGIASLGGARLFRRADRRKRAIVAIGGGAGKRQGARRRDRKHLPR